MKHRSSLALVITLAASCAIVCIIAYLVAVSGGTVKTAIKSGTAEAIPLSNAFLQFNSVDELYRYLVSRAVRIPGESRAQLVFELLPAVQPAVVDWTMRAQRAYVPHYRTNIQVEGVEEIDIVKTDGQYLYVLSLSRPLLLVIRAYPAEELKVVAKLDLMRYLRGPIQEENVSLHVAPIGLYLAENRVVVLLQSVYFTRRCTNIMYTIVREESRVNNNVTRTVCYSVPHAAEVNIVVLNVSRPTSPRLVGILRVSGHYIASRLVSRYLYVLTSEILTRAGNESLRLPKVNKTPVPVSKIYVWRLVYTLPRVITVVAVDIYTLRYNVVSILAGPAYRLYMSRTAMYVLVPYSPTLDMRLVEQFREEVESIFRKYNLNITEKALASATRKALGPVPTVSTVRLRPFVKTIISYIVRNETLAENITDELCRVIVKFFRSVLCVENHCVTMLPPAYTGIIRLDVSGLEIRPSANIIVAGRVLDQFAIEEYRDYLVVATTVPEHLHVELIPPADMVIELKLSSDNRVYVLNKTSLKVVSVLTGLAPGERVYAARLVGHFLYLVTYRRVDPLFAIDLSDPRNPQIVGFLKAPGFSEYLHPLSEDVLVGIGISEKNKVKVVLYDVSDPRRPREAAILKLDYVYTPVFYDHHAFTHYPEARVIAFPVGFARHAVVIRYDLSSRRLMLAGVLKHEGTRRIVYIGQYLYLVSDCAVSVYKLETLEKIAGVEYCKPTTRLQHIVILPSR